MTNFSALLTALWQTLVDPFRHESDRGLDTHKPKRMKLSELVAKIAEENIGLHEEGGPNKGPDLAKIFGADNYKPNATDDGYPWCASFCCYVVKQAMEKHGGPFTFERPTTPSAFGFEGWSLAQDASTQTKKKPRGDIQRGDLVIYSFSHIGIATSGVDASGHFMACEGNTNKEGSREGTHVLRKRRHIDLVRSRIRFTV